MLRSVLALGILFAMTATNLWAQEEESVSLHSGYLVTKVLDGHQIHLKGKLNGDGTLTINPNACTFDAFGDTGACTLIATQDIPVKIGRLRTADPRGEGRRLYRIEGEGVPAGIHLVIAKDHARLVKVNQNFGGDGFVVTMIQQEEQEPGEEREAAAPANQDAAYSAVQFGGTVYLFASGVVPTGGYDISLNQRPERIYPPNFQIKITPPDGVAIQVITPFTVQAKFGARDPIPAVMIMDSKGRHRVPVLQLD
jgi:hypothetical protein